MKSSKARQDNIDTVAAYYLNQIKLISKRGRGKLSTERLAAKKELQDAYRSFTNHETTCNEILRVLEQESHEPGTDAIDDGCIHRRCHYNYTTPSRGRRFLEKHTGCG